tara:strand:+ start:10276 stop:10929 length:654 start_codon:yes stop_codon:yes gene_type:complete
MKNELKYRTVDGEPELVNKPAGVDSLMNGLLSPFKEIAPTITNSWWSRSSGMTKYSWNSITSIQGRIVEKFFNDLLQEAGVCLKYKLKDKKHGGSIRIKNGEVKQVDILFKSKRGKVIYHECKLNLDLDSGKRKKSNETIMAITEELKPDLSGYFVPLTRAEIQKAGWFNSYKKQGIVVYPIEWLIDQFDCPFTLNDWCDFWKTDEATELSKSWGYR